MNESNNETENTHKPIIGVDNKSLKDFSDLNNYDLNPIIENINNNANLLLGFDITLEFDINEIVTAVYVAPKFQIYIEYLYPLIGNNYKTGFANIKLEKILNSIQLAIKNENSSGFRFGLLIKNTGRSFVGKVIRSYNNDGTLKGFIFAAFELDEAMAVENEELDEIAGFKAFAENSHDVIMRFDKNHRHLYVNPIAEKIIGLKRDDILGKTDQEIGFPEHLINIWHNAVQYVFDNKSAHRTEFGLPNGNYIDWFLMPEIDASGNVISVMTSARDITKRKKIEMALKESERNVRILIDSIDDFIHVINRDFNLILINVSMRNFIQSIGNNDDLIGRNLLDSFPFLGQDVQQEYEYVFTTGITKITEDKSEINGSAFWTETRKIPIFNSNARVKRVLTIIRDISERKFAEIALKESEHHFKEFANSLPQTAFEIDTKGGFDFVNETVYSMFGYTPTELLIGRDIFKLFSDKEKDKLVKFVLSLNATNSNAFPELTAKRKDYSEFPCVVIAKPIFKSNKYVGIRGLLIDVSERKKSDLERESLIEELNVSKDYLLEESEKVRQLYDSLSVSNEQLQELNSTKDRMFSIIGHDLRGPISNILTGLDYIIDKPDFYNTPSFAKFLHSMNESAKSTYNLLENLLYWAKNQRNENKFNPVSISLDDIITENISLFKNISKNKQIRLEYAKSEKDTTPPEVNADSNMLRTVVRNLISNAIKFTPTNGTIKVQIDLNGDYVRVCIIDSGVGIPAENLSKIFDAKYGITTYGTNKEKGSGLGLVLCKEFVEKHGGNIWVTSELGKGSSFYFTIPTS